MHSKSDNLEFMTCNSDEVIEELSKPLLSRYQIDLEATMRDNDFIFHCVNVMYIIVIK